MPASRSLAFVRAQRLVVFVLAVAISGLSLRAQSTQRVETGPKSGVTILVSNVYGGVPVRGYVPVHVTINSNTSDEGIWTVGTDARSFFPVALPRRHNAKWPLIPTTPSEVLAPLDYTVERFSRAMNVDVRGPGVTGQGISWRNQRGYAPRSHQLWRDAF